MSTTRRRNATDGVRAITNVFPQGKMLDPGEEFDAPDSWPWGDPIPWDDEVFPAVKVDKPAKPAASKE